MLAVTCILLCCAEATAGTVLFHDAFVHDYTGTSGQDISIYNVPGHDDSNLTISGGTIHGWTEAFHRSALSVSDGNVRYLQAHDQSRLNLSGGTCGEFLRGHGNSQTIISGGTIA